MTPLSITIVDAIGIILIMLILFGSNNAQIKQTFEQKCFFGAAFFCAVILAVDAVSWWTNGLIFFGAKGLNRIVNVIYFLLNPISGMFWLSYVDYKICQSEAKVKRRMTFYMIPLLVHSILSIANCFTDIFFTINPDNTYQRTDLIWLSSAISYCYLVAAFVLIIINRKSIEKRDFLPMLLFPLPPIVCTVVQMAFFGFSLIWIGEAISILVVYIYIQNDEAKLDFLTGLLNRKLFEEYLDSEFRHRDSKLLIGIMLDIDKFKSINDTYGHGVGDKALIDFGKILSTCVNRNDIAARYAGDEFFILLKSENDDILQSFLDKLNIAVAHFNEEKKAVYTLAFSYGCCISKKNDGRTAESFIREADSAMYLQKAAKSKVKELKKRN